MPTPIPIYPSRSWEGNDGNWSTFVLEIGTPPQLVHLLPATSQSAIWPVHREGCYVTDPTGCSDLRGMLLDPEKSTSWMNITNSEGSMYSDLPFSAAEKAQGYGVNALTGIDTVVLGTDAAAQHLERQVIAAYADYQPLVGLFGLSNYSNHVRSVSDTDPTILQLLKQTNVISASYYGYTAGAYYASGPPQHGSLTLGGYDQLRFNESHHLEFDLSDSTRDLLVSIRNITIGIGGSSGSTQVAGLGTGIIANFDSLVPEIWLPQDACRSFETAFGLEWNNTAGYYTVNETQHQRMIGQAQSVVFGLVSPQDPSKTLEITLPYNAFDLELKWPLANISDGDTAIRYFPLRQANDPQEYTLGRTFLQEAYLAVDYDNRKVLVSQAIFPAQPLETKLVTPSSSSNSGLSTGAVVGIAVAGAAIGIILFAIAFWFWRRRRRQQRTEKELLSSTHDLFSRQSMAGTTINEPPTPNNMEYFKPDPPPGMAEDTFKPELDATVTARGAPAYHRHELSAGSIRRTSAQTGISRATISPIENRHARSMSYGSSNGQPSPNPDHSPSPGHPSPPMSDRGISWFSNTGPFYELHANEQAMRSLQAEPAGGRPVNLIDAGEVAAPEEGTLPPVERPAPLTTPPQARSPTEWPPLSPPVDRPAIE